jgi:hypothetical protein
METEMASYATLSAPTGHSKKRHQRLPLTLPATPARKALF